MQLNRKTYLSQVLIIILLLSCDGEESREITPNPSPPYHWYPFENYPLTPADREANRMVSSWNTRKADHTQYNNRWFDAAQGDLACVSKVTSFTANLTGTVSGRLSFNLDKRRRGNATPGMIGGDRNLGPVGGAGWTRNQHYKFEVVIVYSNLVEGFYGQIISAPMDYEEGDMEIEFKNDFPENDHAKLNWDLAAGETKEQFATFEIQGNTVRWIDGPQYAGSNMDDQAQYVVVYAGACGLVTHVEIIEIIYARNGPPTASKLTKNQFDTKVKSWSFKAP
jgi:hypothetical protein